MKKKATIYIVDSFYNHFRIDVFLSIVHHISRNESIVLIKKNLIFINDILEIKKSKKIMAGDKVKILFEDDEPGIEKKINRVDISILYQNEDFLIIEKPPFITCHKIHKNDDSYTIMDFAKNYWQDGDDKDDRYGIVHRLDKETTGLLIIARTKEAQIIFFNLFKDRKIEKKYMAFIEKGLINKEGIIQYRIMRDPLCPVQMTYSIGQGKVSETKFFVIQENTSFDIIECIPKTGRTHQIRVHLKALGFPIIGDKLYGKESTLINRHALHAMQISFYYKGIRYDFISKLFYDMEVLRNNN